MADFQRPNIPYTVVESLPNNNRYELLGQKPPTFVMLDSEFNYIIDTANELAERIDGVEAGILVGSTDPNSVNKLLVTNGQDPATLSWIQINGNYIANKAIPGIKLEDGAITTLQLANACVNASKIYNQSITGACIADSTLDGTKLINDSISFNKITRQQSAPFVLFFNDQQDGTLSGTKITINTLAGTAITDETITEPKYASGSVSNRALASISQLKPGMSMFWNSVNPPDGWIFENGQAISRVTYSLLFAEIGTTFGVGDGATTFNVPDTRGRLSVSCDTANIGNSNFTNNRVINDADYQIGASSGEQKVTLTVGQTPAHTHTLGITIPVNSGRRFQTDGNGTPTVPAGELDELLSTSSIGGGEAHNNMQPYMFRPSIIYTGVL